MIKTDRHRRIFDVTTRRATRLLSAMLWSYTRRGSQGYVYVKEGTNGLTHSFNGHRKRIHTSDLAFQASKLSTRMCGAPLRLEWCGGLSPRKMIGSRIKSGFTFLRSLLGIQTDKPQTMTVIATRHNTHTFRSAFTSQ